jgi:hypothetical protein
VSEVTCYGCEGDCWCHDCDGGGTVDAEQYATYLALDGQMVDIVFDGPPSHEGGRFVEVEDSEGKTVRCGEWIDRGDGYWALRVWARVASAVPVSES